jgi:aromatic-L-amino-acid/L-tryptophan decarboxylase
MHEFDSYPLDKTTLDPEDWQKSRALLHKMVDEAIDYLQGVRERPVWQTMPEASVTALETDAPERPTAPEQVFEQFRQHILPYPMGNIHPRFWAWYMGSGLLSGVTGDFWAAVMNSNVGGGNHAAHKVEEQVLGWLKSLMGFNPDAGGLLVSGGSMANYTALAVARNAMMGHEVRENGIPPEKAQKVRVYASVEVHSCNQKALELLGLGAASLVKVPTLADYTIDIDALRQRIKSDRNDGLFPIAIIGSSGTINTGAIDDLEALAGLCRAEKLWFHVDGAIGAIAMLSDEVRPLLRGIEKADSIALDLHKWLHLPFEVGCVLVKNRAAQLRTFSIIPEYLKKHARGLGSGENWMSEYGLQLSRRFNGLKVWMSIMEHGTRRFGDMITKNVRQAQWLSSAVESSPDMELMAPPSLDIVCFRFIAPGVPDEQLDEINREIKLRIEEEGIAVLGYTTLNNRYCLRVAICNHRSTLEDFELAIKHIRRIGQELVR